MTRKELIDSGISIEELINNDSLKCWDCIYNDNCEEVNPECIANCIYDNKVVHFKDCETEQYKQKVKNND